MTVATPAKNLGLTPNEAWRLYEEPRVTLIWRREELREVYRADAALLRRVRIGVRFRAADLRRKWRVAGVSGVLNRGLWAGVLTYEGIDQVTRERVYRRVK